ncbi:cobalamin biosynthesis protein [Billgrantia azerbaijanica]|nr:cobalamin biosynthesis protein [Halomonas azerbaijanica]
MAGNAVIVAGFGCRRQATPASLQAAFARVRTQVPAIAALAAPSDRVALLEPLARQCGLAVIEIPPDRLPTIATLTQSEHSRRARGTGSVAEAVALAAAGSGARLLLPRHIGPDRLATCAVATGEDP